MIGDLGQAEGLTPVGPVAEQLFEAAVVLLEELAQHQQGEQRVLGEVLAGELGGVQRQRLPGRSESRLRQPQRRLGHQACCLHTPLDARPTEDFDRATTGPNRHPPSPMVWKETHQLRKQMRGRLLELMTALLPRRGVEHSQGLTVVQLQTREDFRP